MLVPLVLAAASIAVATPLSSNAIVVSEKVPTDAGPSVLQPFVSFSIEFAFFPDYAGMSLVIPNPYTRSYGHANLSQGISRIRTYSPKTCWTTWATFREHSQLFA